MPPKDDFHFKVLLSDMDLSSLAPADTPPGTPAFREAVSHMLESEFEGLGGSARIVVGDEAIEVWWSPAGASDDPLDRAIASLEQGDYGKGLLLLRLLASARGEDPPVLYSLGMALSDLGHLDEAIVLLGKLTRIAPDFANGWVAFGVALERQGRTSEALKAFDVALAKAPDNPYAHRNCGTCLLKTGEPRKALDHFRRAIGLSPNDQQAWFGLAQASEAVENLSEADAAYIKIIDLDEYSDIAELAREARGRIAQGNFREMGKGGPRMDAVMYCLSALQKFEEMPLPKVHAITFEIAMLGQSGLDTSDATQKYRLNSLPGQFSGLHLLCFMYVGFKQIKPDADIGFDLSAEYVAALSMHKGPAT